jgi:hypothetical protein
MVPRAPTGVISSLLSCLRAWSPSPDQPSPSRLDSPIRVSLLAPGEEDPRGRTHYDRFRAYRRTHEGTAYDDPLFYDAGADRLAAKFLGRCTKEFREHGGVLEKYDLFQRESDVSAGIECSYSENVVGFGRTNAVMLRLPNEMPERTG